MIYRVGQQKRYNFFFEFGANQDGGNVDAGRVVTGEASSFVMELQEKIELIQLYYANHKSLARCLRAYGAEHGPQSGPTRANLSALVKKFETTCSVQSSSMRVLLIALSG